MNAACEAARFVRFVLSKRQETGTTGAETFCS